MDSLVKLSVHWVPAKENHGKITRKNTQGTRKIKYFKLLRSFSTRNLKNNGQESNLTFPSALELCSVPVLRRSISPLNSISCHPNNTM